MEPGEAMAIAQVASALDAAHSRAGAPGREAVEHPPRHGHGPDGSDHVYLADFGHQAARRRDRRERWRSSEGSIDYVAPEQIAGDGVDGRADVYSLGCVLYECVVGEPPFRRNTDVAVVFAHLDADPPAASAAVGAAGRPRRRDRHGAGEGPGAALLDARAPPPRFAVAVDEASRSSPPSPPGCHRSQRSERRRDRVDRAGGRPAGRTRTGPGAVRGASLGAAGVCPFKGLASFDAADAEYFFGRERLIAELVARLVGGTFLGIVGPSGSGKSSVFAGLIPALAGGVCREVSSGDG